MNYNPTEEEIAFVNSALAKFNEEKVGADNHELLYIVEYDENNSIIAGILGCHSVYLDTMSWQTPDFYKKHGYKIISELENIPIGNKKFHLIKEL